MGEPDDLASIWHQIEERLSDCAVFPAVPIPEDMAVAHSEGDWTSFIDTGKRAGAPIFYAQLDVLTDSMLDEVVDEEDESLRRKLKRRLGEPTAISLAFVVTGILHSWERESEWWAEVDGSSGMVFPRSSANVYNMSDLDNVRGYDPSWARELAEHPEYRPNDLEHAWELARQELVAKGVADPAPNEVRQLADRARTVFDNVVRLGIENGAMGQLSELHDEVAQADAAWSSAGVRVREQLAGRFLRGKYGFPMPGVASALARYRVGSKSGSNAD